ncbi:putative protein lysine methyltransferase Set5p [Monosporozyma servazzii]
MHLKIKKLSLNDTLGEEIPKKTKIPTPQEIILCKEELDTEASPSPPSFIKIQERHPEWKLDEDTFEETLFSRDIYSTDETKLPVFNTKIHFPPCPNIKDDKNSNYSKKHLESIKISFIEDSKNIGRGLFAEKDFKPGQLIYAEDNPISIVPPMEKLTLISHGKTCALCGTSLGSISSHFVMTNGLDCNDCTATWCSKKCKTRDVIHGPLKHNKGSKSRLVNCSSWTKFEHFCHENANDTIYSLGIIFAQLLLNKASSEVVRRRFESLCGVSQLIIDHTNVPTSDIKDSEAQWEEAHKLFLDTFPSLSEEIDFKTFMFYIGKFNINKLENNQVYFITSFINHDCEPNVRYDIDSKLKLSVFARKEIKAGDQLFMTYVNPLHDVDLRRRTLRMNFGFVCDCSRCKKELGKLEEKNSHRKENALRVNTPDHIPEHENNSNLDMLKISRSSTHATRRKSSMKDKRPDLRELLKNGQDFELEIPVDIGFSRRRKSVRFDETVTLAIEE